MRRERNQNLVRTGLCRLYPVKCMGALSLDSVYGFKHLIFDKLSSKNSPLSV